MCQSFVAVQRSIKLILHVAHRTLRIRANSVDFNSILRDATTQATKEKVIFYNGSVFFRTEEVEMLIVTNEDFHNGTLEVSAEVFTQDKEDCLQFNWQGNGDCEP